MKKAKTIMILEAMDQWQELTNTQLDNLVGWRFSWHTYKLREYGVRFEKTQLEWYEESFKIIHIPNTLIYKGRTSVKLIKSVSWFEKLCNKIF